MNTLLPIVLGVAVFAGALAYLALSLSKDSSPIRKRAKRLIKDLDDASANRQTSAERTTASRRNESNSAAERWAVRHLPNPTFLQDRIIQTGRSISPWKFLGVCAALSAVTTGGLLVGVAMPLHFAIPAGVVVGFGLPYMVLGSMAKRRKAKFVNMMPEAIDIIVRGVRSGLPVTEAIATVAREMNEPVKTEFQRTIDVYRLGRPLVQALNDTGRRLDVAEFNFLVVALSIQQETGGNLAETLANLADIIRKRRQMKMKVSALTGEAKGSAAIVGAMPFLMFIVINVMNPGYTDVFFDDPRGHLMIGGGLLGIALGVGAMYKIANFEI